MASLNVGQRLGAYEITAPLGAGGMGEVFRARDTRLDRQVAIKVLPAAIADSPDALARFEREARAVAALSHPNILVIHDFGQSPEATYAVMELLEGETLRARVSSSPLPLRKAVDVGAQIARGLAAAHDRHIVHRDLKPENVFLTTDGTVKILDFGLARTTGPAGFTGLDSPTVAPDTQPGTVLGTVGYMAPEQVRGEAADHRADLFALGCVLYEMISGRRAFRRDTAAETLTAILRDDPPDIGSDHRRRAARPRAHHPPMPREASRRALPVCARSRVRAGIRARRQRHGNSAAAHRPAARSLAAIGVAGAGSRHHAGCRRGMARRRVVWGRPAGADHRRSTGIPAADVRARQRP